MAGSSQVIIGGALLQDDIRHLLPRDKRDIQRAKAIVAQGYPAVAPVMSDLVGWLQDGNWPVCHVIAPFLATVGTPIVPEIRHVLGTGDSTWKYWTLSLVVAKSSMNVIVALQDELRRLALTPTLDEIDEEVDDIAQEILQRLYPVQ